MLALLAPDLAKNGKPTLSKTIIVKVGSEEISLTTEMLATLV
jgi:hypothetical protein